VVFEAIGKLTAWRNAFAHGHCVDRPTKSLRHNHLISPDEYPSVKSALQDVAEFVGAFLSVSDGTRNVSLNAYMKLISADAKNIRGLLKKISLYRCEGDAYVYAIRIVDDQI
jgi:hypothetical protein